MKKKLFLIVGAIVVVIVIAAVIGGKNPVTPSASPLVSMETGQSANAPVSSSDAAQTNELVVLLKSVNTLSLDASIFNDPVYRALDTDALVLPDPAVRGRMNPFAAIGTGNAVITTPAATTNTTSPQVGGPSVSPSAQ